MTKKCVECGAGPNDPCGRNFMPSRCPAGKFPSGKYLLDMARASAVDLRRTAHPTAADSVVALADAYERLCVTLAETRKGEALSDRVALHWQTEAERLRGAIEQHRAAVCDNPKAAGQSADEALWAVLADEPSMQRD